MSGELDDIVLRLWEDHSSVSIELLSIEWEALTNFNDSFIKFVRETGEISGLTDATRVCWRIRRVLLSTPLSPAHFEDELREIINDCRHFLEVAGEHLAAIHVAALELSCVALAQSENPLVNELENLASQFERTGLLLSDENMRAPVGKLLDEFELDGISVLSLKQLRNFDAPQLDAMIYVGNPQQTFLRSNITSKADSQRSGWLITSPPATRTFILETSLSRPIFVDNLWLLQGSRPVVRIIQKVEDRRTTYETEVFEVDAIEPSQISWSAEGVEHRVLCVRIGFQSGRFAFFSDSRLGSPRIIDVDESGRAEIMRIPALKLVPGMVILLQGSRSDTEELRDRAVQLLRSHGSKQSDIDQVLELVSDLKRKLAEVLDASGVEWLEARLRELGLETGYARYLTSAPLHPEYIAPTKGFNQFLATIGLEDAISQKPQIEKYRSACRRAGHRLDRGLLLDLESDPKWEDRLDSDGTAVIRRRESGTLIVERIAYIGDSSEVPMSQIGKMIGATK